MVVVARSRTTMLAGSMTERRNFVLERSARSWPISPRLQDGTNDLSRPCFWRSVAAPASDHPYRKGNTGSGDSWARASDAPDANVRGVRLGEAVAKYPTLSCRKDRAEQKAAACGLDWASPKVRREKPGEGRAPGVGTELEVARCGRKTRQKTGLLRGAFNTEAVFWKADWSSGGNRNPTFAGVRETRLVSCVAFGSSSRGAGSAKWGATI